MPLEEAFRCVLKDAGEPAMVIATDLAARYICDRLGDLSDLHRELVHQDGVSIGAVQEDRMVW
jgi:hypothetical protein